MPYVYETSREVPNSYRQIVFYITRTTSFAFTSRWHSKSVSFVFVSKTVDMRRLLRENSRVFSVVSPSASTSSRSSKDLPRERLTFSTRAFSSKLTVLLLLSIIGWQEQGMAASSSNFIHLLYVPIRGRDKKHLGFIQERMHDETRAYRKLDRVW